MLELLVVVIVIAIAMTIWYGKKQATTDTTTDSGTLRTSTKRAGAFFSQGRLWIGLAIGGAVLAFFFWEKLFLYQKEIGLFWPLVVAGILYYTGTKIKNSPLKVAGVVVALVALLNSGIGQWAAGVVEKVDINASCAANPEQPECVARAQEKAATERAAVAERQRRQVPVPRQPAQVIPRTGPCKDVVGWSLGEDCRVIPLSSEPRMLASREGYCLAFKPEGKIKVTPVSVEAGMYNFSAKNGSVDAMFYFVPRGKTVDGFSCPN